MEAGGVVLLEQNRFKWMGMCLGLLDEVFCLICPHFGTLATPLLITIVTFGLAVIIIDNIFWEIILILNDYNY